MSQVRQIALSPAQRFIFFTLSHDQASKIKDRAEGKRYRRWVDAFGLAGINRAVRATGSVVASRAADETTKEVFEVTQENAETCRKLFERELPTVFEDLCGEVMDLLDDIERGREVPTYPDLPKFNAEADASGWMPEPPKV